MNTQEYAGYFDYASATPVTDEVIEAMLPYIQKHFYNPSALYGLAHDVRDVVESARSRVASVLDVKAQEIIFTSGCTEANNLAIRGVMSQYPDAKIAISSIEHDSVREVAKDYAHVVLPVLDNGILDLQAFADIIKEDVVLVSVMYVNNEIGTIQPLREIGMLVDAERTRRGHNGLPLYFHTDAAQAGNYFSLKAHSLKVDLMSINSGKLYGPKGVGCLYVSKSVQLSPQQVGGGQERGLRSGTENVAGIVGFEHAIAHAQRTHKEEADRITGLRTVLVECLTAVGGSINGSMKARSPQNINIRFEGIDNERLVMELDKQGFMVSSGSACHAKSTEPSHVLAAIGLEAEQIRSSIRITLGRFTTVSDVEGLGVAIARSVAKIT